jgi:TonB family protein
VESGPSDEVDERLDLIPEQKSQGPGVTIAIVASFIFHAALIYLVKNYQPPATKAENVPIARYVELIRGNPQQDRKFVEAPGQKVDSAPITAPWSDANRRASAPNATGDQRTTRPGDGSGLYTPRSIRSGGEAEGTATQKPQTAQQASAPSQASAAAQPFQQPADVRPLSIYQPTQATAASAVASSAVDWKSAIREVGKVASLGGSRQGGADIPGATGGEKGYADNGPISFETQWYDWGEYAESMVSRIRVNWYNNMPELLRTGLKGNVTIRFTIHRDGHLSDVTILNSSMVPPYDFAAKKAIELSSPLNPLPKDFPMATERVTCGFYYNMEVPASH